MLLEQRRELCEIREVSLPEAEKSEALAKLVIGHVENVARLFARRQAASPLRTESGSLEIGRTLGGLTARTTGWRLRRVAGIELLVDYSWLLIFALVTFSLAQQFAGSVWHYISQAMARPLA